MMDDVVVGSGENKDISFSNIWNIFRVYKSGLDGPVLVLLHGGGHSALSWAVFTAAMTSRVTCRVLAMDLRGHDYFLKIKLLSYAHYSFNDCIGDTQVRNSDDLSTQTMSRDVANVVRAIYGEIPPPLILVGHNMGGAIAIHTATSNLIPSVVGLVVIDVVEGSAMDVLHSMQNFLRGRPKTFKSIDHAIEWSIKSGQIRNLESAKVSMVGQVRRCENVDMVPSEQPNPVNDVVAEGHEEFYDLNYVTDKAENARSECILIRSQPQRQSVYSWRIDLSKAEKYWDGWFRGISNLFLSCNVPKLLLLAGIDRLDRDLTIGQMQGKFMMQVLPPCGHAVHEDTPDKVAEALASFMIRQKFAEARSGNKR
ncbi:PPME1 methylesterase, partial [Atractosteus spatula]|nr:PPME1 methylesterase [Atractosteus spatula]